MNNESITFSRNIPVRHTVDVFIAGGGPSGFSAAVAAAKQGAKVYLAEGEACLGGVGTAGGMTLLNSFSDGKNFVAGGVGKMVYERVIEDKATLAQCGTIKCKVKQQDEDRLCTIMERNKYGCRDLYYSPEGLKRIYDDMLTNAGVSFTFGTQVIGAEAEDGWVKHAVCYAKSGLFAVRAKAFVDATGDGDLCARLGAPFKKGDPEGKMQPGTFASFWAGIDWQKAKAAGCGVWAQSGRMKEAIENNVFRVPDPGMPGILQIGSRTGGGNIGHLFGIDGTDEESITRFAIQGRKMALDYQNYFRNYLTGYENMELVSTAARVGIRETRRILGDYVLNEDDYWARAVFDDEIGRYSYALDVHPSTLQASQTETKDFKRSWLKSGESYGIPYRILTPQTLQNVLTAGRCVSTDRAVLGSIRCMPGCYITGQASGTAAAMVAESQKDTHSVNVKELQRKLLALGAYLPNAS